jgi:hypothetical protein
MRTSIGGLIVLVLFVALGLAALHDPTIWWASGLFTAEVSSFSFATLVAFFGPKRLRAVCAGFAIFGLSYFLAHLVTTGYREKYIAIPNLIDLIIMYLMSFDNASVNERLEDLRANVFWGQAVFSIGTLIFASLGAACGWILTSREGKQ